MNNVKVRGCIKVSYEALEYLLKLEHDTIRAIVVNPIEDTISIYHSDISDISGHQLSEGCHQVTRSIGLRELKFVNEASQKKTLS